MNADSPATARPLTFSRLALVALFLAYLVPGLTGHDPWKQDEGYGFGIVHTILDTGDPVVPTLAGEPFMEKPPLYYLTAAGFARLFSRWLPLHDGARLATGLFMALALLFTAWAAEESHGKGTAVPAAFLLAGCVGMLGHSHEMITDVALLAGIAIGFCGLALSRRLPMAAGLLLGTGAGIGFLSKGLIAPGMLGSVALALPLLFPAWRNRRYIGVLAVAMLAILPWITIWPVALYHRSPGLFREWLWVNNFGRLLGFAHLGADTEPFYYTRTLPWFAWPALPLAVFALWREGGGALREPGNQLPLLAAAFMVALLGASSGARALYALPLLVPLSVLAAGAAENIPAPASGFIDRLHFGLFGAAAAGIWIFWLAMILLGRPPALPLLARQMPMDFRPSFSMAAFAAALAGSAAWLFLALRLRRSDPQPVLSWFLGVTLGWSLVAFLLMPWIDTARSYRSMFESMRESMPPFESRLSSIGLGECQRGMLEYVDNTVTKPVGGLQPDPSAPLLIQQGKGEGAVLPGEGWRKVWEGSRPGDTTERYCLYLHSTYSGPPR